MLDVDYLRYLFYLDFIKIYFMPILILHSHFLLFIKFYILLLLNFAIF